MRRLPAAIVVLAATVMSGLVPGSARAGSDWIQVTGHDSVLVGGSYLPRVHFTLHNAWPVISDENPICTVLFVPQAAGAPGDTCRATDVSTPATWTGHVFTTIDGAQVRVLLVPASGSVPCLSPGESQSGFSLTLSKAHNCCYDAEFRGVLFDPWADDIVCFTSDLPVPAGQASWGKVKSIYRE